MAKNKQKTKAAAARAKKFKTKVVLFAAIMLVLSVVFVFQAQIYAYVNKKNHLDFRNATSQQAVLHFIDVGQGDAIALSLPDGKTMLIDSGPKSSQNALLSYLNKTFFTKERPKVFDYFIITHPHEDHIGGSVGVFENFQVNNFYRPNVYTQAEAQQLEQQYGQGYVGKNNVYNTQIFNQTIQASQAEPNLQTVVFANYFLPVISSAAYSFTFITPNVLSYSNLNNYSPIILFEFAGKKVLFTGDSETPIEQEAIAKAFNQIDNIDILKVGHHGSNTSSSQNFINLTKPKYAVIQVAKNNIYNHPCTQAITNLQNVNSNILRTDQHGSIILGFSSQSGIYLYTTTNTSLPVAVEVWQIYLAGGLVAFYFVFVLDFKKLKQKLKQQKPGK